MTLSSSNPPSPNLTQKSRLRKPPFSQALKGVKRFFRGPSYQAAKNSKAGGVHSQAILGPEAFTGAGTDANSNLPSAIKDARNSYSQTKFIAGHLLNADFGGDGKDAKNLTILTSQANSNHKNFDNPLKQAGAELKKAYEALWNDGIDISKVQIGIEVSVKTGSATWGSAYPDNCIFTELQCSAKLYGNTKLKCNDTKNQTAFDRAISQIEQLTAKANNTKVVKNPQPSLGTVPSKAAKRKAKDQKTTAVPAKKGRSKAS